MRLSRIHRIRETARPAAKEPLTLAMPTPWKSPKPPSRGRWIREVAPDRTKPEGVHLSAWSTVPLFIGGGAASSFSLPRKKQRGPEGVAKFYPGVATPSGLPPSPHSSLCLELTSPHGPRGGGPRLPDSSATRCGFARFRDSAASATGGFRGGGWDSDFGSLWEGECARGGSSLL